MDTSVTGRRTWLQVRLARPDRFAGRGVLAWSALFVGVAVAYILDPRLVTAEQLMVIARQAAPLGVLAVGQTVVILLRGFDLSMGAMVALVTVLAANLFGGHGDVAAVVGLCLMSGLAVGGMNGLGVVFGRVSPLIMTLGMAFVLSGAALIFTGGAPTGRVPEPIRALSAGSFLGVSFAVWTWLTVAVATIVILNRTRFGRYVYSVGANPLASRLSGVPTRQVEFGAYLFAGLCAAVGGLLLAGFVGSGSLGAGQDLLLQSIAAVVIGGTTFEGGKGGVSGSVAGALFLTLVSAILTGLGVAKFGNLVIQGAVLVGAAALFRERPGR
jgi:ribose/xylose/arabinose/galactoside ABC-type transport system permease subunit